MINILKKYQLHIFLWVVMLAYFMFGPDLLAFAFTKTGQPLRTDGAIPAESNRITFVLEDLGSYTKDGKNLYTLYGWAFIAPQGGETANSFVREISLVSEERVYIFSVLSGYRNPGPQSLFAGAAVDLNTLGFNALIAEDTIKPGKYRIGIIFRNPSSGSAFYADKPLHYLIKTPNTLRLERK